MRSSKGKRVNRVALIPKNRLAHLKTSKALKLTHHKKEVDELHKLIAQVTFCLVLTAIFFSLFFFGIESARYIAYILIVIVIIFVLRFTYLKYKEIRSNSALNNIISRFLKMPKLATAPSSRNAGSPKKLVTMITYEKLDTSFLNDYKELKSTYKAIGDYYARYKTSDLDERQSAYADNLMVVSNDVIKQLKASYDLNGGETNNLVPYVMPADSALTKLRAVHKELSKAINRKNLQIANELENLELPRYLELESIFDELRVRGNHLLNHLSAHPLYKDSEEMIILNKIVGHRLNELWLAYTTAIKDGDVGDSTNKRVRHPDQVLGDIFAEINEFLNKLESGVKDAQKNQAMNDLLTNQRYFKDRFL